MSLWLGAPVPDIPPAQTLRWSCGSQAHRMQAARPREAAAASSERKPGCPTLPGVLQGWGWRLQSPQPCSPGQSPLQNPQRSVHKSGKRGQPPKCWGTSYAACVGTRPRASTIMF
ncbi:NR1H3 isoform 21 [Pan troglodytes]|uniref:NR1H3 isoform 21 n=1 Tax=Pan troglodytes TaxID=9598 RepID=A0A2J8LH10_PANTR|nr:NR1H3 isoform 21 [Pan troglodytes]